MGEETRGSPTPRTRRVQRGDLDLFELELDVLRLRVLEGPDASLKASFSEPTVRIGTGPDADLVLTDPTVSALHATLTPGPDGLCLRDLGSTNGVFVDDRRVGEVFLQPGDRVRLGDTLLGIEARQETRTGLVDRAAGLGLLVGDSAPMRELYGMLRAVAPTSATVLLTGESGVGKEVVARTLHELSGREGPFVGFDSASVDPQMVRADLLGHVKGAFTGADAARPGALRAAHGGTLFLDEIGELPLDLQPRLLRVLETREVTPVGADLAVPVDVRVVAATHRDLGAMVEAGTFRRDLYHRLEAFPVHVPALRDRPGDVPALVEHLQAKIGLGGSFTPEALGALAAHPWPGNVRELRNVIERALIMAGGRPVGPGDLRFSTPRGAAAPAGDPDGPLRDDLDRSERALIERALEEHGGNQRRTAEPLGISLATLKRRLKRYREEDGAPESGG